MATNTVHLIVYGWDIHDEKGLQFCKKAASGENGPPIPFLFLISDRKEHVALAAELVGKSYLVMPCSPEEVACEINRICSPAMQRQTKRYSIRDTSALIEQRQVRMEASVLNVSVGGSLCEFELNSQLNCAFPLTMSIQFNSEEGPVMVEDLNAVATTMNVITRHKDQTPNRIRMGFKFIHLSDLASGAFARVFAQLEEDTEQLTTGD